MMSVSPSGHGKLRGMDLNHRHPGSEPGVLPLNYPAKSQFSQAVHTGVDPVPLPRQGSMQCRYTNAP